MFAGWAPSFCCVNRRRGYSLVELAITLPTVAILTLGMSAAVLVSVRSIPQPGSLITANTEATRVLERLERDLRCATEILTRTPHEIRFRVPDRTGNGQPETIHYWWSGVAGAPVFRQVNAHAVETLLGRAANFQLIYGVEAVAELRTQSNVVTSPEVLLSSDESWGSVVSTARNIDINRNSWAASVFSLTPQIPLDCSRVRFTRAVFTCRRDSVGLFDVGLYRVEDGMLPRLSVPIGSPLVVNSSQFANTWQQVSLQLANDVWVNDGCRRFALVISSDTSNTPLQLRYKESASAPTTDRSTLRWSSDQGATWQPDASTWHRSDLLFEVYGHFERTIVSQVTETTEHVRSIRVILNSATNQGVRIDASIGLLNQPRAN